MARKVNQAKHEAWRQRIGRQQKSGLTVVEFCRQEAVSTANFHAWKRKLGIGRSSRGGRAIRRQKAGAEADCGEKAPSTQAKVPFVQLPLSAPVASPWIEVVLAEGAVVRLPQQNLSALETVLQTLKGNMPALAAEEVRHA
jgi:hypothetical protein